MRETRERRVGQALGDAEGGRPAREAALMHGMDWGFDNTFARKLDWLGAAVDPVPVSAPSLLTVNDSPGARARP